MYVFFFFLPFIRVLKSSAYTSPEFKVILVSTIITIFFYFFLIIISFCSENWFNFACIKLYTDITLFLYVLIVFTFLVFIRAFYSTFESPSSTMLPDFFWKRRLHSWVREGVKKHTHKSCGPVRNFLSPPPVRQNRFLRTFGEKNSLFL